MSQAANLVEKAVGHMGNAFTQQNVSNPTRDRAKYADPSGETMKALVWNGKNSVKVGTGSSKVLETTVANMRTKRKFQNQKWWSLEM